MINHKWTSKKIVSVLASFTLLILSCNSHAVRIRAESVEQLPPNIFPAKYFWRTGNVTGMVFGFADPSDSRFGSYYAEHPAEFEPLLLDAENLARSYDGPWQKILSVKRTYTVPSEIPPPVFQFYAFWDVDTWFKSSRKTRVVKHRWTVKNYRVCPAGYKKAELGKYENGDFKYHEIFCFKDITEVDVQEHLGNVCPNGTNPINLATGNKYQVINLISGNGHNSLAYSLYYNSQSYELGSERMNWTSSYSNRTGSYISTYLKKIVAGSTHNYKKYLPVTIHRPDGKVFHYTNVFDSTKGTTQNEQWEGSTNEAYILSSIDDEATGKIGGLKLSTPEGNREYYRLDGKITKLTDNNGRTTHFTYDEAGRLTQVNNDQGDYLGFSYDGNITYIQTTDQQIYQVHRNDDSQVTKVVYPDSTPLDSTDNPTKIFHYEREGYPHLLTGITDENGQRYATWTYDQENRAISSEHAGGLDKHTVEYVSDTMTSVTNPRGKKTTYHYELINGIKKVVRVEGHQSDNCAAANKAYTYDTNGFVTSKTDWEGNTTTYVRDNLGRELERVEASGTPEARTITTEWHADISKPIRITEPNKVITFSYDTNGQLLERKEQAIN